MGNCCSVLATGMHLSATGLVPPTGHAAGYPGTPRHELLAHGRQPEMASRDKDQAIGRKRQHALTIAFDNKSKDRLSSRRGMRRVKSQ